LVKQTSRFIMRSSLIAALMSVATLASAFTPVARDTQHLDVFVTEATQDSHAIQVVIGETKVCIGDNGFAPCQATKLSITPNDATVDLTKVVCNAFSDTGATYPLGTFGVYDELDFGAVTAVGSVVCELY
jgi:hypothetical protein